MQSNENFEGVETETIDEKNEMHDIVNVEPATRTSVSLGNIEDLSTGTSSRYAKPRTVLKSRLRKRKNNID